MDEHPHHHRFELSPLFVGLLGILCGAFIVATFHCIAIGWCSSHRPPPPRRPPNRPRGILRRTTQDDESRPSSASTSNSAAQLITVYKHTNEGLGKETICAVCLCEYTEGEELRVLPECAHSFHVLCIDMWLHTHPNCPLCRAGAVPPPQHVVVSLQDSGGVPPPELYRLPDFVG